MSEPRPVRARLAAGERCVGTMAFEFFTPGLTPLLADCGCDFVILDMEHSGAGIDVVKQQIAYARGLPIEAWVRAPGEILCRGRHRARRRRPGHHAAAGRDRRRGQALVEWARYRPEGKRGLAFGVGHDGYRGARPGGGAWPRPTRATC